MNITELITKLGFKPKELMVSPSGGHHLNHEFKLNPRDFLKFAEDDLALNDTRSLVNALSNSKRAIDCQIEKICYCFGINPKRKNLKEKSEKLTKWGVTAPRIINKVTDLRNMLEHDFEIPERSQVEDAVDIATLFVYATDKSLEPFWGDYYIYDNNSIEVESRMVGCIIASFNESNKIFSLYGRDINGTNIGSVQITPSNALFDTLVKVGNVIDYEHLLERAREELVEKLTR